MTANRLRVSLGGLGCVLLAALVFGAVTFVPSDIARENRRHLALCVIAILAVWICLTVAFTLSKPRSEWNETTRTANVLSIMGQICLAVAYLWLMYG